MSPLNVVLPSLLLIGLATGGVWPEPAGAGQIDGPVNTFNGHTLESPLANYPALKLLGTWQGDFVEKVEVYENPGETLTLNGVPIITIRYRFADGLLESIQLSYEGRDNRDKLLQWVEEHYGKVPTPERRMSRMVLWDGPKMTISLIYDKYSKRGWLWFASPALFDMVNRTLNDLVD